MNPPKISLSTAVNEKADALVLTWFQEESGEKEGGAKSQGKSKWKAPKFAGKRSKDVDGLLNRLKESEHFSGKKAETDCLRYYPLEGTANALLLGLGTPSKWNGETARQCGAALRLAQKKQKLSHVVIQGESLTAESKDADAAYIVQAFCEGYWMAGYEYKEMKKDSGEPNETENLDILFPKSAKFSASIERAEILARAVDFARVLGDKPGNVLTPTEFARLSEKMAKESDLKCTVLGRQAIEKEKMGLLIGVAKGSVEEPKVIIFEHRGGKKTDAPIALVGKGITFDSGGISIKPAARMEDMKYDMMGAAAVAGICQAVAELKLPVNVVGIIATCENMPGGKAQKPGDIMRSMTGKTVEIVNTDAEGRLILADAIEYVQEKYRPQAMMDFATLTGAVVVALGSVTGIMGTNPKLIENIKQASEYTGEKVWELPLFEEYADDMKSNYADILNSGNREAGSQKGGIFLKHFVDSKVPWVHFDIAGAAYHRKDLNYMQSKFAAGVMVRLVTHLLEKWKPVK